MLYENSMCDSSSRLELTHTAHIMNVLMKYMAGQRHVSKKQNNIILTAYVSMTTISASIIWFFLQNKIIERAVSTQLAYCIRYVLQILSAEIQFRSGQAQKYIFVHLANDVSPSPLPIVTVSMSLKEIITDYCVLTLFAKKGHFHPESIMMKTIVAPFCSVNDITIQHFQFQHVTGKPQTLAHLKRTLSCKANWSTCEITILWGCKSGVRKNELSQSPGTHPQSGRGLWLTSANIWLWWECEPNGHALMAKVSIYPAVMCNWFISWQLQREKCCMRGKDHLQWYAQIVHQNNCRKCQCAGIKWAPQMSDLREHLVTSRVM